MEYQHIHELKCLHIKAKRMVDLISGGDDWLWLVSFPIQTVYYNAGRGLVGRDRQRGDLKGGYRYVRREILYLRLYMFWHG